jgi:hypothetical protein
VAERKSLYEVAYVEVVGVQVSFTVGVTTSWHCPVAARLVADASVDEVIEAWFTVPVPLKLARAALNSASGSSRSAAASSEVRIRPRVEVSTSAR